MIQASDGYFYGTTSSGGSSGSGVCGGGCGTIFRITAAGKLTTLHSFNYYDGAYPFGGLIQATDGNLYGMTNGGGLNFNSNCNGSCGTIFKITLGGTLTTLHSFDFTDGANPYSGLVQGTDGNIYGATSEIYTPGYGTIFRLSVGLGPFVRTLPTSGKIGSAVKILGAKLTGSTSVTFNGVPAIFKINSLTLIMATVPAGATTGKVQVVTPSGTLVSSIVFRVR